MPITAPPKSLRITNRGRDQLIQIKRKIPFENWNAICRWAYVQSLQESTPPSKLDSTGDSNVEMSWDVFSGGTGHVYWELLLQWIIDNGYDEDDQEALFRRHVHRGIASLSGRPEYKTLEKMLTAMGIAHDYPIKSEPDVGEPMDE